MRGSRFSTAALGLAVAMTIATPARAGEPTPQEVQMARTLFAEGIAFEEKGDYAAALERFHRVATVKSSPSLKFHSGFCEEKLGHLVTALTYYEQAQADANQKQALDVQKAVRAPLENLTAKVPKLVPVVTDAPDLEVSIDGKPIPKGLWGLEIRVELGRHTIEGKAPGYVAFSQTAEFPEASRTEIKVKVELAKSTPTVVAPMPAPTTATPPPKDPSASPAPSEPPRDATKPDAAQPGQSHTVAIATTAGAVVLVGAGVAFFFAADSAASSAQKQCLTLLSCDDKKGGIRTFDALALSGWIGGAALGTIAVIAWTSGPSKTDKKSGTTKNEPARTTELVPGVGSLFLRGTF